MPQAEVEQASTKLRLPESAVEPVAELIEILLQILRCDTVIGPEQEALEVCNGDVYPRQPHAGLIGRRDVRAMRLALAQAAKGRQRIGEYVCSGASRRLAKSATCALHTLGTDSMARNPARLPRSSHATNTEALPCAPRPRFPERLPPTRAFIDLQPLMQPVQTATVAHRNAQLTQHPMRRGPRYVQQLGEPQGRDTALVRAHAVPGPEPLAQRQVGGVEQRPRIHRDLMVTGRALVELTGGDEMRLVMSAARADKPLRPASLGEKLGTGLIAGKPTLPFEKTDFWCLHGGLNSSTQFNQLDIRY
jgi:hypothetical protein